jgi:hypothetical protein
MRAGGAERSVRARAAAFLDAQRLLLGEHIWLSIVPAAFTAAFLATLRTTRASVDLVVICSVPLVPFMIWLEVIMARRLAFVALLPRATSPKWLVLVPACLAALLMAIVAAAFGPLPAPAGLMALGQFLWAIAIARWCLRAGRWAVPIAPLFALAPAVAFLTFRAAGWWAAAAASMGLALLGLGWQPDAWLGVWRSGARARPGVHAAGAAVRYMASSGFTGGRVRLLLQTAVRLWRMAGDFPLWVRALDFAFAAGIIAIDHHAPTALIVVFFMRSGSAWRG